MDSQTVPRGADRVVDRAIALKNTSVRIQLREAVTTSREDAALRSISNIETLTSGVGRVTEHDNTPN